MIYLIGGAPRCGKTILSKKIAAKNRVSWISTDTIRSMVLACTSKAQRDKKFPYEKLQSEQEAAPYTDIAKNSSQKLLRAEITESRSLWSSTQKMIEHLIDCQENYIIEGVHLMPALVHQLKGTRYWRKIRLIFLVKLNLEEIKSGFHLNTSSHDWLSSALKNKPLLEKTARMVQTKSAYIAGQAKRYKFAMIDTGKDFKKKLTMLTQNF